MDFRDIIATRRDRGVHSDAELLRLTQGAADGSIPDYQLAAWLMAAYLNPLNDAETVALTQAMADSGERLDLSGLPKPWVDKHSTGGVGDKTTLVLLPLLAACGLTLVKMSGRGLGITGGTIDKLEAIPGFRTDLSPAELKAQAVRIGLAITGQSPNLAPADKALYALRDVTGTTSSIPLLVSSILCKKIAGGAETLVLDVKCGSGAFMTDEPGARALAEALHRTATGAGLNCRLAITDMSQPLGAAVGNALEVEEAWAVLRNDDLSAPQRRFRELCLTFAEITLDAVGIAEGRRLAEACLADGRAWQRNVAWVDAQGGQITPLPKAPVQRDLCANESGYVARLDAAAFGLAVIGLGGGRRHKSDVIDPSVGIVLHASVGDTVERGQPILTVHARTEAEADAALAALATKVEVCPTPVTPPALFLDRF